MILSALTLIRPVNHDEAYYTYASVALCEGKLPYIDYLYHQMPLMILFYCPVSFYGIGSLFMGRILSVLLLVMSFFLIEKFFIKQYSNKFGLHSFAFFPIPSHN
jgi:hypothetical protein